MTILRLNADDEVPRLHGSAQPVTGALRRVPRNTGPIVVMIHGYSYQPGHPVYCPHRSILGLSTRAVSSNSLSWPRGLGFFGGSPEGGGLAIGFGWCARGSLWRAQRSARSAGRALANLVTLLRKREPNRTFHLVTHSLGIEVVSEALHHLASGTVDRIISMAGAGYQSRVSAALRTPAGCRASLFNVTSRENDLFDYLFERLIPRPRQSDRALSFGIDAPNALTLQLDCAATLEHLSRMGSPIAPPTQRICHSSTYLRPGVMSFYRDLLHQPNRFTLERIRAGLPAQPAPRWSRLLSGPAATNLLPFSQKGS